MIPESILNQVKKEAERYCKLTNPLGQDHNTNIIMDVEHGAEFMYSLLQSQLEEKEKRIAELEAIIKEKIRLDNLSKTDSDYDY